MRITRRGSLILVLTTLAFSQVRKPDAIFVPTPGNAVQERLIQIPRIARPPVLEEFLGGGSRSDMKRVDDFRQRNPGDGVPASQKTSAWLGYDDRSFYVVFVCHAPPGEIRARLAKREDIFSDDFVGVILDTYHDRQRGYLFLANPLGIQADGIEAEGYSDDYSFDTLWYTKGRLTPEGYVVLVDIPFCSLRFSADKFQTWGLGLGRVIPTNNETSFWPYVSQKVEGLSQQLGTADGMQSISPGRNLQFIPYGVFGQSHYLDNPDSGPPSFRSKTDLRAGMDVKAVFHDSLTLDATVNPDFSQVESDDPQVTVNQRYEVQFPEKRPFFLENNGYFSTPETLFFSRRIVDPEFGARLTGKLGRWNIGLLAADDRAAGAGLEESDPDRGGRASILVLRVQREFSKQSNIGALFTDREFAGSFNRVGSLDARFKLNSNWIVAGQTIASQTRALDGAHWGGAACNLNLHGQNRKYTYDLTYVDRGEGFHAELGFVPRVNIRQLSQRIERRFHPESRILLSYGPQLFVSGDIDHRNVQQDWTVSPGFNFEMARSTYFNFSYTQRFERFNDINFRRDSTEFGGRSEYFKRVSFDWGYSRGTRINYSAPAGVRPFLADGSEWQAHLTFRPSSRLKLETIYYLTRLRLRPDAFAGIPRTPDGRPAAVFVNHLARTRLNYQFTRALSLRLIADYNGMLENPSLVSLERQKRITGDALLTYLIHPGTAVYAGYTDRLENQTIFAGAPPFVGRTAFPSITTGRQLFLKVSYLVRL